MELEERVVELERRLEEMVVRGIISARNAKEGWVVVSYGTEERPMKTGKLPIKPIRSGKAIIWWFPEVGEGVTVISPGDLRFGEVYPGSYYAQRPAPSSDPDLFLIEFGDGSSVSHHRKTHLLEVINLGDIHVSTQKNVVVNSVGNATVTATGTASVSSSVKAVVKAPEVNVLAGKLNLGGDGGKGVVTGDCMCPYTGAPHSDVSSVVFAKK